VWSSLRYSPQILLSPAQSRLGAVRRGRAGRHRRRGSLLRSGLGGCHRDAGATTNASAIVGVYRTSPTPRRFFFTCPSKVPHTLLLQQGALRRSGRNFGEQTACQAEGSSRLPFLAFQDPEELGTDEPPDVSKSARDRPVHTRAYGTVTWGKGPRRRRGQSTSLSSSVAAAGRFRRALRSMPSSRRWSRWRGGDDHDFCVILRRMLRAVGDAWDVSRLGRDRPIYSGSPSR